MQSIHQITHEGMISKQIWRNKPFDGPPVILQLQENFMSTSLHMQNPEPFLHELHGKVISVMLKWGWQLRGILQSKDEYMNLLLTNAEEVVNGQSKGELGEILIRCNNILYIRETA